MLAARADALLLTESPEESPIDLAQEAVDLLPEDAGGLRAKVLAIQARVLSGYGRYDEAQAAGLDALALAERLDLHELASDVITTLSNLKKAGPKEGLRTALLEAVDRAVETGAIHAELRARFFLGRSYQDWAEWPEAEKWFRSAMQAAADAGLPYAPYGFESRWQLSWIKTVDGDWDEALRLTDTSAEQVPPIPAALLEAVGLLVESGRGEPVAERARALRRFWELEGGVAINSVVAELVDAARDDDPRRVVAVYQDAVDVLGRIWHEWFSARIRLAAITIGAIADALPRMSAADRGPLRRGGRAAARRGPHGARQVHRPLRPLGPRGPGLGQAAGRRDAARPLAGRRRRPAAGGPGRGLARGRAAVRRLRPRPRARHRPRRPGRHPARHRRPGRRARARRPGPRGRPPAGRPAAPGPAPRPGQRPAPAPTAPPATPSPPASPRSSRWWPRAAPTARSASSCSSARRPSRSTSPTSSASSDANGRTEAAAIARRRGSHPAEGGWSRLGRRGEPWGLACVGLEARWARLTADRPARADRPGMYSSGPGTSLSSPPHHLEDT